MEKEESLFRTEILFLFFLRVFKVVIMKYSLLLFVFFICLLMSCGGDENSSSSYDAVDDLQNETHDGMIFISSKGRFTVLGSNILGVLAKEAPEMTVKFDYNFFMDQHEVTCKDYNSLVEKSRQRDCDDELLPVSNVSFYDAVLFANARSKAEKLDTVYSYTSAEFDSLGNCTLLENLYFHSEYSGYRLPSEAEWVYAASQGWNPEEGWHSDNADFKTHDVCTSKKNSLGLCDMEGNVKEWVNDKLGYFKDTTLTNFMGPSNESSLGERVVKGGSYRNAPDAIKLFHRGDTYAVTSSTRTDYVGFRLVYGPVVDALWMNADGNVGESEFFIEASADAVRNITGTYRSKLVFRNDINGNLVFVDYNEVGLRTSEIIDTLDSYHPDISPDGSKVAFCTGMEGVRQKSELYVRDLNAMGTGLVKLDVKSASVPRWRVLENGDTVIVYVDYSGDNSEDGTFLSASTWQVKFTNGKFGKPEKLFTGAFHGGVSYDDKLAVSGSRKLRALVDGKDEIWYNEEQACNVSLSKDSTKRTLFLDFGGEAGTTFVGKRYKTHQRILVADSAGKLVQSVESPAGYTFDHTEWSSNNLVVASLTNDKGSHTEVVLVDMADSSKIILLRGEELWHPCLWVDSKDHSFDKGLFKNDSAGVYLVNTGSARMKILRYRMENYWRNRDSANVVVLGSSRASNGVDSGYFDKNFKILNMSFFPSTAIDVQEIYDRYIDGGVLGLKYLVVSLDLDIVFAQDQDVFFHHEYKSYPGYVYDENHDFWKNTEASALYEITRDGRSVQLYSFFASSRSTEFAISTGWPEAPEVEQDSMWMKVFSENFNMQMECLKYLAKEGVNNGFYVIAVIFPQAPGYAKTGAFGRHGLQRSLVPAIMDTLDSWQKMYPSFVVLDENKMGYHDYAGDMAQDCDHLNRKGAAQLTTRLNALMKLLKSDF